MPQRPNRKCRKPGCGDLTRDPSGYCPTHQAQAAEAQDTRRRDRGRRTDQARGTAHQRGYGLRWQRYRISFLSRYPYCGQSPNQEREQSFGCLHRGVVKAATVIDHITPGADAPNLFWDQANHQSLCRNCHDIKTRIDISARRKATASA